MNSRFWISDVFRLILMVVGLPPLPAPYPSTVVPGSPLQRILYAVEPPVHFRSAAR